MCEATVFLFQKPIISYSILIFSAKNIMDGVTVSCDMPLGFEGVLGSRVEAFDLCFLFLTSLLKAYICVCIHIYYLFLLLILNNSSIIKHCKSSAKNPIHSTLVFCPICFPARYIFICILIYPDYGLPFLYSSQLLPTSPPFWMHPSSISP